LGLAKSPFGASYFLLRADKDGYSCDLSSNYHFKFQLYQYQPVSPGWRAILFSDVCPHKYMRMICNQINLLNFSFINTSLFQKSEEKAFGKVLISMNRNY
jgi:hypothetical protein